MAKEELTNEQVEELNGKLDELFKSVDLNGVSSDSTGFDSLPDGYFLAEVKLAEVGVSKSSQSPQVAIRFKTVEDGSDIVFDDAGDKAIVKLAKTKNITVFKYYPLRDDKDVKRYTSDMLKFEVDKLPKEAFIDPRTIRDALSLLDGRRVYIQNSTTIYDDGSKSSWINLISWKRAAELGLDVD